MTSVIYQYGMPVPPFGAIDAGAVGQFPIQESVDPLNLGAHENMGLLLVAYPFNGGELVATPAPIPFGTPEGRGANTFDIPGKIDTVYVAATEGRSTAPDDEPANAVIPGMLDGDVQMRVSLFGDADPLQRGESGFGDIQLQDPAGRLDTLSAIAFESAAIELRRGRPETPFSTWSTVARLTSAGLKGNLLGKTLTLRPLSFLLENAELHGQRYAGAGGREGDASLAGRLKPYLVGYVNNITPVLFDSVKLIGQVSCSSVAAISAAYDGRSPLGFDANYSSYEALRDATVAPGSFATCRAEGMYRLGSAPVYGITCDVQGDADVVDNLPGPVTRGRVVRRIATGLGSFRLRDSEQIDFVAFQDFENKQPSPCGWYWDGSTDPMTKADAITEVLGGVCGWWTVRPNGQLSIGQVEDPEAYGATLVLDYPGRLGDPEVVATLPPRRATFIGYQRNYTIQRQDQLAGFVSQAEAILYSQPSLFAGGFDQWRANNFPTSPAVRLLANFRDEADARAEYERQQALFGVTRTRYAIPVATDSLADAVAQRAQINDLNRLGFGARKRLLTCGIEAAGGKVSLHFWG